MTTTATPSINVIMPTGTAVGPWPTGWTYADPSDVWIYIETDGVPGPDLIEGPDYTLMASNPQVNGGQVALTGPTVPVGGWTNKHRLIIRRWTARNQGIALPDTEGHKPRATERGLDRAMRIAEELTDDLDLTVKVAPGETPPSPEDLKALAGGLDGIMERAVEAGAEAGKEAGDAAAGDKANKDAGNLTLGERFDFRSAIGAVSKTGDTVTGPLNTVRLATGGATFGGGNTAVLHSYILGGDGGDPDRQAAVFDPRNTAEFVEHSGIYSTREAVNFYAESAIKDGLGVYRDAAWNVPWTVTAYLGNGFKTATAIPDVIKVGSWIETLHAPNWWSGRISAISEDRKTVTISPGWVRKGTQALGVPAGTTGLILNIVTKKWIANWNLIPQPGSRVFCGVIGEFGVINRRGSFVEGFGGAIGDNDFSGVDLVSFGDFQGNFAFRSRQFRNGFLVEGGLGDGTSSAFRVKNVKPGGVSFNPGWGLDLQQADGVPIMIRPEVGDATGVYDVNGRWFTNGSMDLGSRNFARDVSISLHSFGRPDSDYRIVVSGGSPTVTNAGQAVYLGGSHVFAGPYGHPTLVVGGAVGTTSSLKIDGGMAGAPVSIYAQGAANDVGLLLLPKGAESGFLNAGNMATRFRWNNDGLSFYGVPPTHRQVLPAAATDQATTMALVNALRSNSITVGLFAA